MLKIKKILPMFNRILVTSDKYEKDVTKGGVVTITAGTLKEYQKVIAVGSTVRDIKEGDTVIINPSRYAVKKHAEGSMKDGIISDNPTVSYNFNLVEINNQLYILLYDQDVDYVVKDFEEVSEEDPKIIMPVQDIIL